MQNHTELIQAIESVTTYEQQLTTNLEEGEIIDTDVTYVTQEETAVTEFEEPVSENEETQEISELGEFVDPNVEHLSRLHLAELVQRIYTCNLNFLQPISKMSATEQITNQTSILEGYQKMNMWTIQTVLEFVTQMSKLGLHPAASILDNIQSGTTSDSIDIMDD